MRFKITKKIYALHKALEVQAWLQKRAKRFLATGATYAGEEMLGRYHAPGSLEGWILVKGEDPKTLYEHVAE